MTAPLRQRWIPALLVAAGLAVLLVGLWSGRTRELFDGESDFGRVRVVERSSGVRELYLGSSANRQTAMDPSRPGELVLPYTRVMLTGVALVSDTARVLVVGLGGGALPRYLAERRPGVTVDAVDINPVVARVARDWFGLEEGPRLRVHVEDGRDFVSRAPDARWDLVLLDAFSEEGIPERLATQEFAREIARVLAPGGAVVSNLHTIPPRYDDMLATWLSVFPHAVEVDVPARRQRILIARAPGGPGEGPALSAAALGEAVDLLQEQIGPVPDLSSAVADGFRVPNAGRGSILRDASRTGDVPRFATARRPPGEFP